MNDQTYFLANAAHELQTLLSLLCSSIQAIEAAHPEVRCYRYWPELSSDCRLMTKLLRDLTDYSMSDQLTKQRSDLCNLLRRAYLSCIPLTPVPFLYPRERTKHLHIQAASHAPTCLSTPQK